jgi:hypothetical protein
MGQFWALETGCRRVSPSRRVNLAVACALLIACRLARVCVMSSSPAVMWCWPGGWRFPSGMRRWRGWCWPAGRGHRIVTTARTSRLSASTWRTRDRRAVLRQARRWLVIRRLAELDPGRPCRRRHGRAGLGRPARRRRPGRRALGDHQRLPGDDPGRAGAPRAGRRAAPCWRAGCRQHAGLVRPACRGRPARWRLRRSGPDRQFRPPVRAFLDYWSDMDARLWEFLKRTQDHDPVPDARRLRCPHLAVFGGADELVSVAGSTRRFSAAACHPGRHHQAALTIEVFPGAEPRRLWRGSARPSAGGVRTRRQGRVLATRAGRWRRRAVAARGSPLRWPGRRCHR